MNQQQLKEPLPATLVPFFRFLSFLSAHTSIAFAILLFAITSNCLGQGEPTPQKPAPKEHPIYPRPFRYWTMDDPFQLMNIDQFWGIIDEVRKAKESADDQEQELIARLTKLSDQEIVGFQLQYGQLLNRAYDYRLWNAVYLINSGCGDDRFFDFRVDLVMKGKDEYEKILADPEALLLWPLGEYGVSFGEHGFCIAGEYAMQAKHGKKEDGMPSISVRLEPIKATGKDINTNRDEEVKKEYPKIWAYLQNRQQEENKKRGEALYLHQLSKYILVTPKPFEMDSKAATDCRAPAEIELNPHASMRETAFCNVYVNSLAEKTMLSGTGTYPEGSIIIKSKLPTAESEEPSLFTVMQKMKEGYDSQNGNWRYSVIDGKSWAQLAAGRIESCIKCHVSYQDTDFVTRTYLK